MSTSNTARITVTLPAQARLYVDNVPCPLNSGERAFNTPALQPGQRYYYTLRVELDQDGDTITDSRRVLMAAGENIRVDFSSISLTAQR